MNTEAFQFQRLRHESITKDWFVFERYRAQLANPRFAQASPDKSTEPCSQDSAVIPFSFMNRKPKVAG